jgi:hypothetical protein
MPWTQPEPLPTQTDLQKMWWQKEIWTRGKFFTFSWTPPVIFAGTIRTFQMAATGSPDILTNSCLGLRVGMGVKLTSPAVPGFGLVWDCTVLANDTLTIWFQNLNGGADVTPPAGNWNVWGMLT